MAPFNYPSMVPMSERELLVLHIGLDVYKHGRVSLITLSKLNTSENYEFISETMVTLNTDCPIMS